MRNRLLLQFLTSSIVSDDYNENFIEEVHECKYMEAEGLVTIHGMYTGCASVRLTDKGREAAEQAQRALPKEGL